VGVGGSSHPHYHYKKQNMKKKLIENFHIPDPVYNKPVTVIYDCTNDEFHDFLDQQYKPIKLPRGGSEVAKYVFIKSKKGWYDCFVWVGNADTLDPLDVGSISHELAHHTFFVLNFSGVEIIPGKSEEAFTYYHTYLLEYTLCRLKSLKRVLRKKQKRNSIKKVWGKVKGAVDN